jgi:hypothetical protein
MILNYRYFRILHWLCFNLQTAGAVGEVVAEYTRVLDISIPSQLRKFQRLTLMGLLVNVWTRGKQWTILCIQFFMVWYEHKAWAFLAVGSVLMLLFSAFNVFLNIVPYYKRYTKFLQVSVEYAALPVDTSNERRRASLVALENVAARVVAVTDKQNSIVKAQEILFAASYNGKSRIRRRRSTLSSRQHLTFSAASRVGLRSSLPPSYQLSGGIGNTKKE